MKNHQKMSSIQHLVQKKKGKRGDTYIIREVAQTAEREDEEINLLHQLALTGLVLDMEIIP